LARVSNQRTYRLRCPKCGTEAQIPIDRVDPKPVRGWRRTRVECRWPVKVQWCTGVARDPPGGGRYNSPALLLLRSRPQWRDLHTEDLKWWDAPSPDPAVWLPALLHEIAAYFMTAVRNHQGAPWRIQAHHKPAIIHYGKMDISTGKLRWVETHKKVRYANHYKRGLPPWAK